MTEFKAAAIQMRSGKDPHRNAADFERLVREAAAQGAVYIQSPEMTGAIVSDKADRAAAFHSVGADPVIAASRRLSKELGVFLHVGSTAFAVPDGKIANRAFGLVPDGLQSAADDKIHMFDVDLDNGESWRESATYTPGDLACVTDLPFARLGLAICYDMRFPHLFQAQAQAGAQVLTAPAAFTRQTGEAHWHVLLRARAIENGAWMIAAAQGGKHDDGRETYGHSIIIDPWGRIAAEVDGNEPGFIVAQIDPAQSAAARAKIPNLKNGRAFTVEMAATESARDAAA